MKRIFDFIVSLTALIVLLPIIALVAWKIRKNLGSPVLFRQTRPGLNGKSFEMFKFRSMKDAVDANGNLLPDDQRMTPFGGKLRSSSLDELPGLWNVLKGDMSLVGPRPALFSQERLRNERKHLGVYNVRPGITGLSQVSGLDTSTPELLAKTDAKGISSLTLVKYFKFIIATATGKGSGDAATR